MHRIIVYIAYAFNFYILNRVYFSENLVYFWSKFSNFAQKKLFKKSYLKKVFKKKLKKVIAPKKLKLAKLLLIFLRISY